MNFILPLILLLSSLGIFFGYVDTTYKGTSATVDGQLDTYGINKLQEEHAINISQAFKLFLKQMLEKLGDL